MPYKVFIRALKINKLENNNITKEKVNERMNFIKKVAKQFIESHPYV
jgi:hypothetical protein